MKRNVPSITQLSIAGFMIVAGLVVTAGLLQTESVQDAIIHATSQPANLVVDVGEPLGYANESWGYLAQGGESPTYSFAPVKDKVAALQPKYIRIDHLYDFHDIVHRNDDGSLRFEWAELDQTITDIRATGAVPFISLSYTPPALNNGDLVGVPNSWTEWQQTIAATIVHISRDLAIPNVYYEVWNEPDLFGQFKTYGEKNYLDMYYYAAKGAQTAKANGALPFKFGGPATTALYKNWVTRMFSFVHQNNLPFDFYSWHRYSYLVSQYNDDIEDYNTWVQEMVDAGEIPNTYLFSTKKLITEWGPDSDVAAVYDGEFAAAHFVAVTASINDQLNQAYAFEIQDGLHPEGKEYWGRWGMMTHQSFGSKIKPRYQALQMMNRLADLRLDLQGEGTFVKALATQTSQGVTKVIIANYDSQARNNETVPVAFTNVKPGNYVIKQEFLNRGSSELKVSPDETFSINHQIGMPPNSVVFVELIPEN